MTNENIRENAKMLFMFVMGERESESIEKTFSKHCLATHSNGARSKLLSHHPSKYLIAHNNSFSLFPVFLWGRFTWFAVKRHNPDLY